MSDVGQILAFLVLLVLDVAETIPAHVVQGRFIAVLIAHPSITAVICSGETSSGVSIVCQSLVLDD